MNVQIRSENSADIPAIHEVIRRAFGQEDEARLVDALRDGGYVRLSLVAEADGDVIGHILLSELPIITNDGRKVAALSLAPVAVTPEFQRRGVGGELIRAALAQCAADGRRIVIVLGHAEYYPRFGFSAELARKLVCPFPVPAEVWMAIELSPGALEGVSGRVQYAPPFAI